MVAGKVQAAAAVDFGIVRKAKLEEGCDLLAVKRVRFILDTIIGLA